MIEDDARSGAATVQLLDTVREETQRDGEIQVFKRDNFVFVAVLLRQLVEL